MLNWRLSLPSLRRCRSDSWTNHRQKSRPRLWAPRRRCSRCPKDIARTGLCQQSNKSPLHRNGNWKIATRDWSQKPAPQEPKCQKLRTRDWGHPSLTWFLVSRITRARLLFEEDAPNLSSLGHEHVVCGHCCSMSTIVSKIIRVYRSTTPWPGSKPALGWP
jgi:hypothetical protein